jgi:hypothetical protein
MKYIFTLICLLATGALPAQDCKNYYYLQNNKTIEMTIYSRKGDVAGRNVYHVSNVKPSGASITSEVNSEMFDKKGKSIAKSAMNIKCTGGVMMMDMKMMIPTPQQEQFKMDAKADNVYIEYPNNMKSGDMLKDANMSMDVNNNGVQQSLTMNVTNRKVEGKESVTSPAGTWECFKITSKTKLVMKMGPIGVPMNMETTEWFAPGFGVVKTESKHGSTLITSVK